MNDPVSRLALYAAMAAAITLTGYSTSVVKLAAD
jgi:hypothetical protein